jgi:CHASE2 domain-containing sensor protein
VRKTLEKARFLRARGVRVRGVAIAFVAALVVAWLLSAMGFGAAIDRVAQRSYYELRGARETAPLLFVAIDEHTVDVWGPPPWPWSRYQELIAPMRAGGARMIALVEPGPRIVADSAIPTELTAGVGEGWLLIPSASFAYQQPAVALSSTGVVDAIDLGDPVNYSITRDLLERLGAKPSGRTIGVNFIGSPDRLPTIPAHHVSRGELPPSTFYNRVIVIGLRGERFSTQLPTPVGPMSPAELHAHAVHAQIAQAHLVGVSWWLQLVLLAAITAVGVFVLRRMRSAWVLAGITVASGVLLYVVGFLVFRFADARLAIGEPAFGLFFGGLAGLILDRRDVLRGIDDLRRQFKQRLQQGAGAIKATEEEIHDRFADMLRSLLPATSCVWAEMPADGWHVELKRWYEGSGDDVLEQRRDVRRDPWRLAYGSHKPEWANRPFMKESLGQKSLMVPIAAFGRLLGFWVVNMPSLRHVPDVQLRMLEQFSHDVAIALSQQQLEWKAMQARANRGTSGALVEALQDARHDAATLAHAQDRTRAALEYLPIGVLSATSWGMIEHTNATMRQMLAGAGIASPERAGTVALLAELAGTSPAGAREMLHDAGLGKTVRFVVTVTEGDAGSEQTRVRYDVALKRVEVGEAVADEHAATAFVLTATPRLPEKEPAQEDERLGRVIAFRKPGSD